MKSFSLAQRRRCSVNALALSGLVLAASASLRGADTTAVLAPEYHIYAGSTHAHTQYSWSHGEQWVPGSAAEAGEKKEGLKISPEGVQGPPSTAKLRPEWQKNQGKPAEHFARAKAQHYDFYTTTDHSQEAALNPPSRDNPAWADLHQAATAATDGTFIALVGYEHSENNGPGGKGHLNVINSAEYLNALAPGVDLPTFYKWLGHAASAGDGPVVAVFNHPGAHQYDDFSNRDEAVTEVLALLEVINSNKNIHYAGFLAALDKGWKVSPVCGNDNHGFYGITNHTSRTFVLATSRTKAAILEAMRHRRTYAALDQNIQCRYTVNGAIMGSTLAKPEALDFKIAISDPDTTDPKDKITKIDIVTDGGAVVETYAPPEPAYAVTWNPTVKAATGKYYFVRVWNAGGGDLPAPQAKPDQPVAWLAPVWTGK
jgi:hypothetical protein